jgi:hypothetical protein
VFPLYNLYASHRTAPLYYFIRTLSMFSRIDLEKLRTVVLSLRDINRHPTTTTLLLLLELFTTTKWINSCSLMDLYLSKHLLCQPFHYWTRSWESSTNFITSQLISLEICIKVIISNNTATINWILRIHAFFFIVFWTNWRCTVIMS